jgi:hypothetical protein
MKVEDMLIQGKRIMLAAIIASAIGLSCAGCLSSSSVQTPAMAPIAASPQAGMSDQTSDVIRLTSNPYAGAGQTYVSAPGYQHQDNVQAPYYRYQYNNPNEARPSNAPLGSSSGIDLTIAEFAQANSPYRSSPLTLDREWREYDTNHIDAEYTFIANKADTGLGMDLSLSPRVSFDTRGDVKTTRAGAEVRVGANLDLRGQNARNSNWYFFAGADGEAVVWDVQRAGNSLTDGQFTLQDKVTVGDVQAGIGFESPAGHMSLSYINREYEYRNGEIARSGEEDFVAVTLTWRR